MSNDPVEQSRNTTSKVKVTVEDLKAQLKALNKPSSGTKDVLINRLGWAELSQSFDVFKEFPKQTNPKEVKTKGFQFSKAGPVLKRIPKGSRFQVCNLLTEILEKVVTKNDLESWESLMKFPNLCLGSTKRGGKRKKSLATIINSRVDLFSNGSLQPEEWISNSKMKPPLFKNQISAKISTFNIKGAIRIMSSSDSVLPPTPDVVQKLTEKHPERVDTSEIPSPDPNVENSACSKNEVKKAIQSFDSGLAGGPDGLLPQHLKDLTEDSLGEPASKLLDAITNFINKIMYAGIVPKEVCEIVYGASLTALSKKCGGVRPIAVGMVWRRLASKILMCQLHDKCESLFSPNQLGVGTPKGAEGGAHALRSFVNSDKISDQVVFKIDLKNAFNCIIDNLVFMSVRFRSLKRERRGG